MSSGSTLTLNGGSLNANAGLDNSAAGTLSFLDGTLAVRGGAFAPNAGGLTDDYIIDGPTASELPHLVLGTGATLNVSDELNVGQNQRGQLTIQDGGQVFSDTSRVGGNVGSTGTVTVSGSDGLGSASTWSSSIFLVVGQSGAGTLNILDGGVVSSLTSFVGSNLNSTGTVTVDGAGSTWDSANLTVGIGGDGTLNILNGGAVINNGGSTVLIGTILSSSTATATVMARGLPGRVSVHFLSQVAR
jgi:T5SS/PEP-CTERM-associated repeat protein